MQVATGQLTLTNITNPANPVVVGGVSDTSSIFASDGSRTVTLNDFKANTFDLQPGTYTLQATLDITGQASGNQGPSSVTVDFENAAVQQHQCPRRAGDGAFGGALLRHRPRG